MQQIKSKNNMFSTVTDSTKVTATTLRPLHHNHCFYSAKNIANPLSVANTSPNQLQNTHTKPTQTVLHSSPIALIQYNTIPLQSLSQYYPRMPFVPLSSYNSPSHIPTCEISQSFQINAHLASTSPYIGNDSYRKYMPVTIAPKKKLKKKKSIVVNEELTLNWEYMLEQIQYATDYSTRQTRPIKQEIFVEPVKDLSKDKKENGYYYEELTTLLKEALKKQDAIDPMLKYLDVVNVEDDNSSSEDEQIVSSKKRKRKLQKKVKQSVSKKKKIPRYDKDGVRYPDTRAPKTVYKSFIKYEKKTSEKWFRRHVHGTAKRIFEGVEDAPPFRIIQLNVDAKELLANAKANVKEDSPNFEDQNHYHLPLIEEPAIVIDRNYRPLIVSVQNTKWYGKDAHKRTMEAMETLAHMDGGSVPSSTDSRNKRKEMTAREYVYAYYFEQGFEERGPLVSRDCLTSCQQMKASAQFLNALGPYGEFLSVLIYIFDREFWHRAVRVCRAVGPEADFLRTNIWEVFLNTIMISEKTSTQHLDLLDAHQGFAVITSHGEFTGGELCFPDLGCKFPHRPSDILLFRSRYLRHYLAPYKGWRFAIIRFIHEGVMSWIESQ
jgi:hypothetical protein